MNPDEVLMMVEALSTGKRLPMDTVFEIMEEALAEAACASYENQYRKQVSIRVDLDRKTCKYKTFRTWRVAPEEGEEIPVSAPSSADGATEEGASEKSEQAAPPASENGEAAPPASENGEAATPVAENGEVPGELEEYNENLHLRLSAAQKKDSSLQVGDVYEEAVSGLKFGRISAQRARQVIVRKVREAERSLVVSEYEGRNGELVNGVIEHVTRDGYIVILNDNVEALLPHTEVVGDERFHSGDRVRAVLYKIDLEARGMRPQLQISRCVDEMLIELFKLEVPEVAEQVIEIRAVAREPGSRAKIAVKTNDGRIDPVGVCVGMRGSRVQAVTGQLNDERVDIILWDDSPQQLVINALSPAQVGAVFMDEGNSAIEVTVAEENLAQALGIRGENVRLASKLVGWKIKIVTPEEAAARSRSAERGRLETLARDLELDLVQAAALQGAGFADLDQVCDAEVQALTAVEGIDEALAVQLQERAENALMVRLLSDETDEEAVQEPADDLLNMEGMDRDLAYTLSRNGIVSMEKLAEQSVDELLEIEGVEEEQARKLILTAREPWFSGESKA